MATPSMCVCTRGASCWPNLLMPPIWWRTIPGRSYSVVFTWFLPFSWRAAPRAMARVGDLAGGHDPLEVGHVDDLIQRDADEQLADLVGGQRRRLPPQRQVHHHARQVHAGAGGQVHPCGEARVHLDDLVLARSRAQRLHLQRAAPLRRGDDARGDVDQRVVADGDARPALPLVGQGQLRHGDGAQQTAGAVADGDQVHLLAADAGLHDDGTAPGGQHAMKRRHRLFAAGDQRRAVVRPFDEQRVLHLALDAADVVGAGQHRRRRHVDAGGPPQRRQLRLAAHVQLRARRKERRHAHGLQLLLDGDEQRQLRVEGGDDHVQPHAFVDGREPGQERLSAGRGIGQQEHAVGQVARVDAGVQRVVRQADVALAQPRVRPQRAQHRDAGAGVVGGVQAGDADRQRVGASSRRRSRRAGCPSAAAFERSPTRARRPRRGPPGIWRAPAPRWWTCRPGRPPRAARSARPGPWRSR